MLELNKVYNEDCVQGMMKLDDCSIDLTVTSPPYDDLRSYNGYSFDFESVAQQLYRVTKDGGVVVWVVGDGTIDGSETGTSFRQALYFMQVGFKLHDTMIYQKHNPTPNTGNGCRYQQCFDYMFVLSKGKPKTVNLITEPRRNECNDRRTQRMIRRQRNVDGEFEAEHLYKIKQIVPRSNIWNYKVGLYNTTSDKIAFDHPAIFPEELAKDHIITWSTEGDTILDPFIGSGTVAKECILLNRNYIGFEISEKYCDIINKRLYGVNNGIDMSTITEDKKTAKSLF